MNPPENKEPMRGKPVPEAPTEAGLFRLGLMVNVVIDRMTAVEARGGSKPARR
jgi:hypothetical protein